MLCSNAPILQKTTKRNIVRYPAKLSNILVLTKKKSVARKSSPSEIYEKVFTPWCFLRNSLINLGASLFCNAYTPQTHDVD